MLLISVEWGEFRRDDDIESFFAHFQSLDGEKQSRAFGVNSFFRMERVLFDWVLGKDWWERNSKSKSSHGIFLDPILFFFQMAVE